MSARKVTATLLLLGLLILLVPLMVAFPAAGHDRPCPEGWTPVRVQPGTFGDDNNNGLICFKRVEGNGNSGMGFNTKDDHVHK